MLRTAALVMLIAAGPAFGDEATRRHDWFKSLTIPGVGTSCCDAADCMRTEAEWRDGQWWAVIRRVWTPIPPERVLKKPTSIDGDAYACSNPEYSPQGTVNPLVIYCFVPPDMGY